MKIENFIPTIGKRLLAIREMTKLNQREFAAKLGVVQSTYARYERGKHSPDLEFCALICSKLSVNTSWLLLGEGQMQGESALKSRTVYIECTVDLITALLHQAKLKWEADPDSILKASRIRFELEQAGKVGKIGKQLLNMLAALEEIYKNCKPRETTDGMAGIICAIAGPAIDKGKLTVEGRD